MKVLMINGSPRENGNTATALKEMEKIFSKNGIECETVCVGKWEVRGCLACRYCHKNGKCAIDDEVNQLAAKLGECDGLVVGTPVYYAAANGTLTALLDRLFYSSSSSVDKTMKVAAAVAVARRSGVTAALDQLNKYFSISGMPIAPSVYWNGLHGRIPGEVSQDDEGIHTVITLAENMSFLIKSIALGKEKYGLPKKSEKPYTNFIR